MHDDFGNLRYIIQPELTRVIVATDTYNPSVADLNMYSFNYKYDERKRVVEKKLPGAEPIYMVYDDRNRLVLAQDGNQRSLKQWSYIKYDGLDRPVVKGVYTHDQVIDQQAMTDLLSTSFLSERFNGNVATHGYTSTVFTAPNFVEANFEVLSVIYYDNYSFKNLLNDTQFDFKHDELPKNGGLKGQNSVAFVDVKTQQTGNKTKVLNSGTWLWSVVYYDEKYRPVQAVATNHSGGFNRTTSVYDFSGKVLRTKTTYSIPGQTEIEIEKRSSYDHASRLLKTWHKINDESEVLSSALEYNELGQLVVKKLHQTGQSSQVVAGDPMVGQPGVTYSTDISVASYSNAQHTYVASNSIRLLPGFLVPENNTFQARIGYSEEDAL